MLVSLNWLKKFVEIPKGFTPEDLALKLTMATVEVEGIERQGGLLNNVVVGKVLAVKPHPNADKLKLATVDAGREKLEVVCGGVNLKEGMLVALAKIGARVRWHGEAEVVELKPAKIRGVESNGMICASEEIGLENLIKCGEHEIADLSNLQLEVGAPLAEALKLDDAILEIDNKSMTHRPDLWGVYGLARDLAAVLKVKLNDYQVKAIKAGKGKKLTVEIKDQEKCQRYLGVVLDNIKIGPSPASVAGRLEAVGVRAINNIVDITNYVMLELGQPLHAFDWREIEGGKIVVETAKKGEKFTTLDGQTRVLDETMLLIKDAKKPVALAGVMGGQNSEIKNDTTAILFEAASFKAGNIRRTSMKLGLRSESSARFEKGLSPLLAELAIKRAVELTLELIPGAKVASAVADENFYQFKAPEIELDLNWLNRRLGVAIEKKAVAETLTRLGFAVKEKKDKLLVKAPYWRAMGDVSLPEDLVEEVARVYGYDNIKPLMPEVILGAPEVNQERQLERQVKNLLAGYGFIESYNYSFVGPELLGQLGLQSQEKLFIKLKNYLSPEQSILRPVLTPGLLQNAADNLRFYEEFKIFELGRAFLNGPGEYNRRPGSEEKLPWQHQLLSGVMVAPGEQPPFYLVKGAVESLLQALGYDYYFGALENIPGFMAPSRTQKLVVSGEAIGQIGELNAAAAATLGIKVSVGLFELDFTKLAALPRQAIEYEAPAKYPSVWRDLAILVDLGVKWEEIKKAVKKTGGELIQEIELFDVYTGDKIGAGSRSLAFHLEFRALDRTLAAEEADGALLKIKEELEKRFGAKSR
ncbi:MAG: phenylalanine--tRNA ligase subunit beta [Patescibacteria group bacterium]|jgi:phenylalanyl-tRNA synthetase beta chain